MYGYQNPGPTQSTNIRNNQNITELLTSGEAIDIFALPDNGLMHYGIFHINLAAGLEDSIISTLDPEWNNVRSSPHKPESQFCEPLKEEPHVTQILPSLSSGKHPVIKVQLHKTYYNQGFFNITTEHSGFFGNDRELIEIHIDGNPICISGYINRSANTNGTPRIMGGKDIKDWFQKYFDENAYLKVEVLSPNAIKIGPWS